MKRVLCIFLTFVCIFVFASCNTSADLESSEVDNTHTPTTTSVATPELEETATIPEETTFGDILSEESTPEESTSETTTVAETTFETTTAEETTPEFDIMTSEDETTTPVPETTTSESDNIDPPEKPNDQLTTDFIIKKLAMFESVFVPDSHKWCIYDDVMGSAVTEVLAKQDLLMTAGCNEEDINLASQATENLRVLLGVYNGLRTKEYSSDDEKYTELYQYYIDNYDALTQNFCDLYKTLRSLYQNGTVSFYISWKGKAEHYRQLVGQLYVVSTAFDMSADRDEETWRIDGKKLNDVIEDIHYFPDGDWCPRELY